MAVRHFCDTCDAPSVTFSVRIEMKDIRDRDAPERVGHSTGEFCGTSCAARWLQSLAAGMGA